MTRRMNQKEVEKKKIAEKVAAKVLADSEVNIPISPFPL